MKLKHLRVSCKKLLVDLDLDKRGNGILLADALGINHRSLNMALSGYRENPGSAVILENLKRHLEKIKAENVETK
jgi:hypothetical protein